MLPHKDGGVVNPNLIVYGTANLRVVDLSIVPIHVSAHVSSLEVLTSVPGSQRLGDDVGPECSL